MRRKFVAGNWKMHGSLAANAKLLDAVLGGLPASDAVETAVCVPFPYLAQAREKLAGTRVAWGAQNLSQHAQGAYTGEVSAAMLLDFGCRYVIVGHSERRSLYGDSDALVAAKYDAALKAGLTPILCLGETLEQREAGVTAQVVNTQLDAVMDACGAASLGRAVVAYEPVWAIGTGRTATPDQAQEVHALIRARVSGKDPAVAKGLQILYGGSVKASNAKEIFAMPDIDGGLIGGASLVADDFLAIVKAGA
ncbi:MAG TPA: triose-phosphate isomerase [Rhodocyclaceae bacterium]|jgi:triosephosphate isomerase|nr:triose-phosphate isomerase [Rhodocyclaceae bacterium]